MENETLHYISDPSITTNQYSDNYTQSASTVPSRSPSSWSSFFSSSSSSSATPSSPSSDAFSLSSFISSPSTFSFTRTSFRTSGSQSTFPFVFNSSASSSAELFNGSTTAEGDQSNGRFPPGGIAGIVVGGVVALVIVIVVVVCCCCAKRRFRRDSTGAQGLSFTSKRSYSVTKGHPPSNPGVYTNSGNVTSEESCSVHTDAQMMETSCSEEKPPPIPRRDPSRANNPSKTSPNESIFTNHLWADVTDHVTMPVPDWRPDESGDPDGSDDDDPDAMESFPDEPAPPPPRDSCYVIDS